jgi:hypothetical protein
MAQCRVPILARMKQPFFSPTGAKPIRIVTPDRFRKALLHFKELSGRVPN